MTVPQAEPGDAPVQDQHQDGVQDHVDHVGGHGHGQRGAGVLQPAEHAGPGQYQQHGGRTEQADPQVDDALAGYLGRAAERVHDLPGQRPADGQDGHADERSQPQPVDALADRGLPVPGAELPGHRGGGPIGQEDRDADQRGERLAGHGQPAERNGAQSPDDGRIRQQEQRFGHQCAERRHGQPENLPVVRVPPGGSPQARSPGLAGNRRGGHVRMLGTNDKYLQLICS